MEEHIIKEIIKTGDIVCLTSDKTARGAVLAICEVDGKKKYTVFIDGEKKPYYDNQIELAPEASKTISPAELRTLLTALQINKPSSDSLYSLNAAKVDFVPYQFRPALKLLKSDVPRLLIADSVGVGKTIEAGLILKELQARLPLRNVLIICPKALVAERKWEMEMKYKFDEEFIPVDGPALRNVLKDCDRDEEWPEKYSRAIIPYSILSDEQLMEGFNRKPPIPGLNELDPPPHFDLVIVDEAHRIRNSNTQAYRAVKYFCDHADAAIFLTATPLQLGSDDLYTLLNVLFPDKIIDKATFDIMTEPNASIHEAVREIRFGDGHENRAVELLASAAATDWGSNVIAPHPLYPQILNTLGKGDLSRADRVKLIDQAESLSSLSTMINRTRRIDIADQFCIREARALRSAFTERQQEMHDALIDFQREILTALHGTKNLKFMLTMLRHQAASCIFGLAPSIEAFANKKVATIMDSYGSNDDERDFDLSDIDFSDDEGNIITQKAAKLIELSKNLPEEDTKFDLLMEIIKEKQKQDKNKIIIFTTFKHTQRYLQRKITLRGGVRTAIVNGDVKDDDRYDLRQRFAKPKDEEDAIDVLLFTEVGSEGLDYQFCDSMVNYDLPWNPMRIEQRIGRIDRRGQESEKVSIFNCITEGTIDADIFDRCHKRIGVFEKSIGDCDEILGNLTTGIEEIFFDNTLTDEQRAEKLEKLAENEVRNIAEQQRLETEAKEFFGIDTSDFKDALDRATNPWLAPEPLRELIAAYLEKRLMDDIKHLDGKLLRLSADAKLPLKDDFAALDTKDKPWGAFLRDTKNSAWRVTFEQNEAKKDFGALFVNPAHPFAKQAAKYIADAAGDASEMIAIVSVKFADVPEGAYPFALYSWEYTGEPPQMNIISVCKNEKVQEELQTLLLSADAAETHFSEPEFASALGELDRRHRSLWEEAWAKHREDAENLCSYKIESLTQSHSKRMAIAETRPIEKIREGEKRRLAANFNEKTARLKDAAETADILFKEIARGVIVVKGEEDGE